MDLLGGEFSMVEAMLGLLIGLWSSIVSGLLWGLASGFLILVYIGCALIVSVFCFDDPPPILNFIRIEFII